MGDHVFRYEGYDILPAKGLVRLTYSCSGEQFVETVTLDGADWDAPGADAAARLLFFLAGVSYYKAFAPPVVDLGDHPVPAGFRAFLRSYYRNGLGEFAFRNDLDLRDLTVVGGTDTPAAASAPTTDAPPSTRPLVPFGGGMDSIVSVELVKAVTPDAALFVVSRPADRFEAIERAAAVTGLPVVRAGRELDPKILRSAELGYLNGHVPVTAVVSAIAVLAAVTTGRDAVVMSNEWSASAGNVAHLGEDVNHQWSKGIDFERGVRAVLDSLLGPRPDYFSLLRPFSELWIARRFAALPGYLTEFRSCNRAFHLDPARRLDHWCGRCDKCAFIDLVLSPFVPAADLAAVFRGDEPLANPAMLDQLRALIGGGAAKPFECVGDVDECRAAVVLAADRPDRAGNPVLGALVAELDVDQVRASVDRFLAPLGAHFVPGPYAAAAGLE